VSNTDNSQPNDSAKPEPPVERPPVQPPRRGPGEGGCLTAFLVVTGGLLLVPGVLCAIIFGGSSGPHLDSMMSRFVIIPFLGVLLILIVWAIIRESRRQ
jgi:hypothetical protein